MILVEHTLNRMMSLEGTQRFISLEGTQKFISLILFLSAETDHRVTRK